MNDVEGWKKWEGRVLDGRISLKQWLSSSERSAVFLTERKGQGKAAIKLIKIDAGAADRQMARLRAASELSHPHLIRIFETGQTQIDGSSFAYVVMEFADEDLSQILPQRALSPAEVSEMLPPLLDALSYLHDKGLVHGHVKPSNVLAVSDDLKLSSDQVASYTAAAWERGAWGMYDAPERAAGKVSPASDVWSVGVMIVAALTQNAPAVAPAGGDSGAAETIPEPFRGIARECLQIDPAHRCSIADIRERLRPEARSVPAAPEPPQEPSPRSGRGTILWIICVLAVLGIAAIFYSRGKNGAEQAPAQQQTSQPAQPTSPQPSSQAAPPPTAQTPATEPAPAKKLAASRGDVIHKVLPEVPASARNTITGTVKVSVRVDVDPNGKVTEAKLASEGPSHYFANLALNAAKGWEFSAPVADGQAIASVWIVKFRFRRASTQASADRAKR